MTGRDKTTDEVIIEFIVLGGSVKVSAIDVKTGEEVSIVGPAGTSQAELERNALAKLKYVLAKKTGGKGGPGIIA